MSKRRPTVKTIVADYLRANGYDGLCNFDCGCALDDLMPCDHSDGCEPAYNHPTMAKRAGDCVWMTPRKVRRA